MLIDSKYTYLRITEENRNKRKLLLTFISLRSINNKNETILFYFQDFVSFLILLIFLISNILFHS